MNATDPRQEYEVTIVQTTTYKAYLIAKSSDDARRIALANSDEWIEKNQRTHVDPELVL